MNDVEFNLLDMLGEMHDTAVGYSNYMKECKIEDQTVMLKDLINRIIELHDFIFENINLDNLQ